MSPTANPSESQQWRNVNRLAKHLALLLKDQISGLGPGSLRAAIVTAELVFRQLITDMLNKIPSLGRGAIVTAELFRQITDSILKKIPDPVGRGAIVTAQLFRQITDILKKNLILVSRGAIVAAQLFRQIIDIFKKNPILVGSGFLIVGLSILLPSALVVAVNAIGFTAAGVLRSKC